MADIITPAGRIVWGNPLNGRDKTDNNNQVVINPQTGQPVKQWSFGLAIPKNECGALFQAMQQEAAALFPTGVPQNFAWKFKDGDGLDDKGIPFANREGYAGCVVLSISTEAFAPRVVRLVGGSYQQMVEGIKTGDYVRVAIGIKGHAGKPGVRGSVPGLYINPSMIEFIGYGQEIISGPDASTLFGGQSVALPPGASATPVASAQPMPTGYPQPGAPVAAPAPVPQAPAYQQPAAPGMPGNFPQPAQPGQPAPVAGVPSMPGNAMMNSGSAGTVAPTYPSSPHPGFVNQAMPGMLPGQPGQ